MATLFDHTKFHFGIKHARCKVFSQHDFDNIASITFTISAPSLPGGKVFGKFIPFRCNEEYTTHSAHLEPICLSELKDSKLNQVLQTCPDVIQIIQDCPITCKAFQKWMPLRRFGTDIHYRCTIVFTPVYAGNLEELIIAQPRKYATTEWLKYIIFTILASLLYCQTNLKLNHNDLHCENVLVDTGVSRPAAYVKVDKHHFSLPAMDRGCILWDFEFSDVFDKKVNPKNIMNRFGKDSEDNIPITFNPYYDAHVFLMRLAALKKCPSDIKEWIYGKYPQEVRPLCDENDDEDDEDWEEDVISMSDRKRIKRHQQKLTDILKETGQTELLSSIDAILSDITKDVTVSPVDNKEHVNAEDEVGEEEDIYVSYDDEQQTTFESFYDKNNTDYDAYHNSHLKKEYLEQDRLVNAMEPPMGEERNRFIHGFRLINKNQNELVLPTIQDLLLDNFFDIYRIDKLPADANTVLTL